MALNITLSAAKKMLRQATKLEDIHQLFIQCFAYEKNPWPFSETGKVENACSKYGAYGVLPDWFNEDYEFPEILK